MDERTDLTGRSGRPEDSYLNPNVEQPEEQEPQAQSTQSTEPEEIHQDIEATRAEMSETIDEIQERLSPDRLMDQARESVRSATVGRAEQAMSSASETARETGTGIMETIKQNPIPAAMAAFGVGWLFTHRSSGQPSTRQPRYTYYGERHPSESTADQMRGRAEQLSSRAQDQANQLKDQAQGELSQWSGQAQQQFQETKGWFDQMIRENPLGLGAIALGAGLAVGLAVPETQREHEMMGGARDAVMEKAQQTAQDTMHRAEEVARTAQQSAQEEGKPQGLSGSS